eukprot:TRINITY_DN68316_c0_g1_i1.p1 TRINITY_DN68316_c0_g1~~TRINITY_DN68316_c0_g1_i1.p1  ORF type:complete len:325 (+),score=37.19 TRINITY_DN68316_c0_g1_i1:43-1017(+)
MGGACCCCTQYVDDHRRIKHHKGPHTDNRRRLQIKIPKSSGLGTTAAEHFLTELEYDVWCQLNKLRTNPSSFIPLITEKLQWLAEDNKTFWFPNQPCGIISPEGRPVFEETIAYLRNQRPVPAISTVVTPMTLAARDHANDIGRFGGDGHQGTDQSTCGGRLKRYGQWKARCAEVIAYGAFTGQDIVLQLVVDDGVLNRSHRKHLFISSYTVGGVGVAYHKKWGNVCVIEMANNFIHTNTANHNLRVHNKYQRKYHCVRTEPTVPLPTDAAGQLQEYQILDIPECSSEEGLAELAPPPTRLMKLKQRFRCATCCGCSEEEAVIT